MSVRFFNQILSMEEDLNNDQMGVIFNILKLVIDEQNKTLLLPFLDVEIEHTIFSMAYNKFLCAYDIIVEFF